MSKKYLKEYPWVNLDKGEEEEIIDLEAEKYKDFVSFIEERIDRDLNDKYGHHVSRKQMTDLFCLIAGEEQIYNTLNYDNYNDIKEALESLSDYFNIGKEEVKNILKQYLNR